MTEQTENIINVRKPIKVLHFSDGVLEIFDDEDKEAKQEATVEEEVNEVSCWTREEKNKETREACNRISQKRMTPRKKVSKLFASDSPMRHWPLVSLFEVSLVSFMILINLPNHSTQNELSWAPWLRRKASHIGTNVINGLDYAGEKVANFLQITTPKYAYEIDQFKKMEAKKAREEQHENNWTASSALTADQPITTPPAPLSTNPIDMKV